MYEMLYTAHSIVDIICILQDPLYIVFMDLLYHTLSMVCCIRNIIYVSYHILYNHIHRCRPNGGGGGSR